MKIVWALILLFHMLSVFGCNHQFTSSVTSEGPSLPIARAGHAGGVVASKVIIVGGNNWSTDKKTKNWLCDTYVFDGNSWGIAPALPSPIADMMYAYNSKGLYLCGGTDGANKLNSTCLFKSPYEPPIELNTLPVATKNGGAAILNGILYVTCGRTPDGLTNKTWQLDTNIQESIWKQCSPFPGPAREYPAVVSCGNYIYVLAGFVFQNDPPEVTVLRDAYQYDPKNNKWEQKPDLPLGGYAWSASAIDNRYVLLTGRAFEKSQVTNGIWNLDTKSMSMRQIGTLQIQACAAPLIRTGPKTWWYVGGEPDANRSRTPRVSIISLK